MQKFMQILATLALLLVLALVIPLTLAACGGTRTEDTSYPRPEYSGSPMAERVMKRPQPQKSKNSKSPSSTPSTTAACTPLWCGWCC